MSKNFIRFEIGLVLLLSLGTSAVYSLLRFAEALLSPKGIGGTRTDLNPSQARAEFFDFSYQLIGILFAVAPAILVLYLLRRDNEKAFDEIGIWPISRTKDLLRGLALAAVIGIPGLALYASARALGLAAQVVPADLSGYWWTVPMLLLSAVRAAIQEEVIMVAYLYKRFDQLGLKFVHQQLISATIRALYHSYQGFAGIVGNFVMGLIFGWAYRKWGRVMPLILAHFFLDAVSFVGYALLAKQLASLGGIF
jgi:membrane protease YdiL (CAAX protease family)